MSPDRLGAAIEAIDRANADDPETIEVAGERGPKELVHARMMTEWLLRLDPSADEFQQLAARAHHVRRWELPRSDYPEGRAGYLRWRSEQKKRHAATVAGILGDNGYEEHEIQRVAAIVRKEGFGRDQAVQTQEDALCLVFLETQLDDLLERLGYDHTVEVLLKTMRKMSPAALEAAAGLTLGTVGSRALAEAADRLADD